MNESVITPWDLFAAAAIKAVTPKNFTDSDLTHTNIADLAASIADEMLKHRSTVDNLWGVQTEAETP